MKPRTQAIAFLTGLTAGAVVALLYAPQSGEDTRQTIRDTVDQAGEKLSAAAVYLREQAEHINTEAQAVIERTRKQVEGVLEQAGTSLTATLEQASQAFNENANHASAAVAAAVSTATSHLTDKST